MISLDATYWQNRYINNKTGWDLGKVSNPLKEYIDQLENKDIKILIPGAGNSHEAIYLYEKGFKNIHILDIVDQPLQTAQKKLPQLDKSAFIIKDYFEHTGSYDLIIEQTFFCALEPRFRESYVKKTAELLKDNGAIVGLLFDFREKRSEPPFGGTKEEYLSLFKSLFDIAIMEKCYNSLSERHGKELFIKLIKK